MATEAYRALALCLGRELESIERLLEVLKTEHVALGRRDAASIDDAVAAKNKALAELDAIGRERDRLMRAAGFDPRYPDPMAAKGPEAQQRLEIARSWRRLIELGEQCLRQNSINGALIQTGLRHARQVLALLRGQRPDEHPTAYGPAPRRVEGTTSRALGKA